MVFYNSLIRDLLPEDSVPVGCGDWDVLGLSAASSSDILFDNVFIVSFSKSISL